MLARSTSPLVALVALGIAFSSPAFAFGGDGAGTGGANKPVLTPAKPKVTKPVTVCRKGSAWNRKTHRCAKARSHAMSDEDLLQQGRLLALAGHYGHALPVLQAIRDKTHDPLVYTYIGYSHRKLGQTQTGIAYYHRALAIDPNSLNTHEYLGEGYVALGRLQDARIELAKVERLCGTKACEQYEDLAGALAGKPTE